MGVSTSLPEPWQLVYDDIPDDEFVDGLRISTDCLARRLIEPLDPDRYHEFPEHLGHRGHGFERILQEWLLGKFGVHAQREVVVPWEYGETHLDLLMPEPEPAWDTGGRTLQLELKANKDAQVRTENVRQVQRQMFATERAIAAGRPIRVRTRNDDGSWTWGVVDPALYTDAEWRVLVIDPSTWRVPDPRGVRVTITDERRAELEAEWQAMHDFMQLPVKTMRWNIEWSSRMPTCTCGKCFRPDVEELDQELASAAERYLHAQEEVSFAADEQDQAGNYLKSQLLPKCPPNRGHTWLGSGYRVTLSKPNAKGTRSLRVSKSDGTVGPQL